METRFIRALVTLGVPGAAFGIFYLVLRGFDFQFSQIDPTTTTGSLAFLVLLIVGAVTTLLLWRPNATQQAKGSTNSNVIELDFGSERVKMTELMRSVAYDVIKIEAHTHLLGVAAEYEWMRLMYPKSEKIKQSLVNLNAAGEREIFFDVLEIKLKNGKTKELYFDIASFFGEGRCPQPISSFAPPSPIQPNVPRLMRGTAGSICPTRRSRSASPRPGGSGALPIPTCTRRPISSPMRLR
jgi:hypothetical protein